jgi:diguanylate cyclase (GGDEF)-like protein
LLAIAAACALTAVVALPAAAVADPLDGLGLEGPIGQSAQSAVPPVTVGAGPPQVSAGGGGLPGVSVGGGSLVDLNVGGTPPGGGNPGSQPSSGPAGQATASPSPGAGSTPSAGGAPPTRAGGTGNRRGSDKGSAERGSSSRGASSPRSGATAGRRSPPRSRAASRAQGSAGTRPRRPSIATRIVDRIPAEYRTGLLALAAIAILFGLLSLHESRRSRHAREDALADSLTGLANRQAFEQRLEREWRRAVRYERELGLLMLDLDGFKEINDTQGHMAGDRVLREAAAAISGRIRETDFAARFGGDEFVVLCPETADGGLKALSDGLEGALRQHRIEASVGFSQREPADSSPQDMVARADAAMYRRKRASASAVDTLAAAEA